MPDNENKTAKLLHKGCTLKYARHTGMRVRLKTKLAKLSHKRGNNKH
jgi:hypothetical protein